MAVLARRELFFRQLIKVQPVVRFTHCQLSSSVTVIGRTPCRWQELICLTNLLHMIDNYHLSLASATSVTFLSIALTASNFWFIPAPGPCQTLDGSPNSLNCISRVGEVLNSPSDPGLFHLTCIRFAKDVEAWKRVLLSGSTMPKGLVSSALKAAAKIFSLIIPPFRWMVTER